MLNRTINYLLIILFSPETQWFEYNEVERNSLQLGDEICLRYVREDLVSVSVILLHITFHNSLSCEPVDIATSSILAEISYSGIAVCVINDIPHMIL